MPRYLVSFLVTWSFDNVGHFNIPVECEADTPLEDVLGAAKHGLLDQVPSADGAEIVGLAALAPEQAKPGHPWLAAVNVNAVKLKIAQLVDDARDAVRFDGELEETAAGEPAASGPTPSEPSSKPKTKR